MDQRECHLSRSYTTGGKQNADHRYQEYLDRCQMDFITLQIHAFLKVTLSVVNKKGNAMTPCTLVRFEGNYCLLLRTGRIINFRFLIDIILNPS